MAVHSGYLRLGLMAAVAGSATACSFLALPPAVSVSTPDVLHVISRAEWEAAPPDLNAPGEHGLFDPAANLDGWLEYSEPLDEILTTVVVHHSALPLSDGPREIQKLHMENKGFADIGYHFLIDERGQVYEGRAINVRGAHTAGFNTGTDGYVSPSWIYPTP